jgi:diphthamide synthase (EF-2-diphthine--ammonia ligase)
MRLCNRVEFEPCFFGWTRDAKSMYEHCKPASISVRIISVPVQVLALPS